MEQWYLFFVVVRTPHSPGGNTGLFPLGQLQSKLLWTRLHKSLGGHALSPLRFTRAGVAGFEGPVPPSVELWKTLPKSCMLPWAAVRSDSSASSSTPKGITAILLGVWRHLTLVLLCISLVWPVQRSWAPFHMLTGHQDTFLQEASVHAFAPF